MGSDARLNVGVAGAGIGAVHIEDGYAPNAERFRVAAICGLDVDRRDAIADRFDIPLRLTDFDALLTRPEIDVIDICTPPYLHYEQSMAALAAGKHVFCEKPVCGSLAEADDLIAAAKASPGRFMPIFQYRFGAGIAEARAIIEAGIAGRPYLATAETFWKRRADYYAVPWRGVLATELGGVLTTQAMHLHDLATHLMGPIARVQGYTTTRVNDVEVEDCAVANCVLASGALLSLAATLGSQDEISRLRLAFENVTFESDHAPYWPGRATWTMIPASDAVADRIAVLAPAPDQPNGFAAQLAGFYDALTTGNDPPVTLADARAALELATAIFHSSRTGCEVLLPIGPDHPAYHGWREGS